MTAPDFTQAVEAVYRAAAAPGRWPAALSCVADHIGADGGLIAFHPRMKRRGFLIPGRLREDLSDLYLDRYGVNPIAQALARTAPNRLVVTNALVDMPRLRRSAFHADILAPQKIDGMLATVHPSLTTDGATGGLSFTLSPSKMDDIAQAIPRLRSLLPHLSRAIDLSLEVGRQVADGEIAASFLERTSVPSLLLDDRGRVTFANAGAERLLAEADGLVVAKLEGLRLAAADETEDLRLCEAIRQACTIAGGQAAQGDAAVRVTRPSGRSSLLLLVSPTPAVSFPFWPAVDRGGRVLVQIPGAQSVTDTQAAALQAAFGLTAAEARVAKLVGQGRSAPEAAAHLGLLPTTVKSHLARCFDKADVRSQAGLARLIATLPDRRVKPLH